MGVSQLPAPLSPFQVAPLLVLLGGFQFTPENELGGLEAAEAHEAQKGASWSLSVPGFHFREGQGTRVDLKAGELYVAAMSRWIPQLKLFVLTKGWVADSFRLLITERSIELASGTRNR